MANVTSSAIRVLLFSSDLMLISSTGGAAAALGFQFKSLSSIDELRSTATAHDVLCVDLASPAANPVAISEAIRSTIAVSGIAFGPHVHTAKLSQAREAGFAKVMRRGQFVGRMVEELSSSAAAISLN